VAIETLCDDPYAPVLGVIVGVTTFNSYVRPTTTLVTEPVFHALTLSV
jgi:hypothetical protein